jgi:hypothetical protein
MSDPILASAGSRQPSKPRTSHRNGTKALRSPMAPRLGLLLHLCMMTTTARLWSLLDNGLGQRQPANETHGNFGNSSVLFLAGLEVFATVCSASATLRISLIYFSHSPARRRKAARASSVLALSDAAMEKRDGFPLSSTYPNNPIALRRRRQPKASNVSPAPTMARLEASGILVAAMKSCSNPLSSAAIRRSTDMTL